MPGLEIRLMVGAGTSFGAAVEIGTMIRAAVIAGLKVRTVIRAGPAVMTAIEVRTMIAAGPRSAVITVEVRTVIGTAIKIGAMIRAAVEIGAMIRTARAKIAFGRGVAHASIGRRRPVVATALGVGHNGQGNCEQRRQREGKQGFKSFFHNLLA